MSTRGYGAVLALVALFSTAGCAKSDSPAASPSSAGSPSPSAAAPFVPQVGQCFEHTLDAVIMTPVATDCAKDHVAEVASVGALNVGAGGAPKPGSPERAPADAECRTKVAAYVGAPLGRRGMTYEVGLPTSADWDGGQHWFACEVIVVDSVPGIPQLATVDGSYAAGKTAPLPRCFTLDHSTHDLSPVDCATPHSAEYVGAASPVYGSPSPKNNDDPAMNAYQVACRDEIAGEMGVTAKTLDATWGYNFWAGSNLEQSGVAVAQCYFVLWNGKTITGSVFGTKGKNIPRG